MCLTKGLKGGIYELDLLHVSYQRNSNDFDQTARIRKLICAFIVHYDKYTYSHFEAEVHSFCHFAENYRE